MRILYLSCHSVLEYDELRILRDLSDYIFSPGAYLSPNNPGDGMRPGLNLNYDERDVELFKSLPGDGKDCLSRELTERFDVIIVMHEPRWIVNNWDVFKHKTVIWRTIGQVKPHHELELAPYRSRGLKIVRYSPKERNVKGYLGADAVIRFGKDPNDFPAWTGEYPVVMNITQSMKRRASLCGWQIFNSVTEGLPRELYGTGNEGLGDFCKGKVSYEELLEALKTRRVYFYTGTQPAPYTLNFIEAWMSGIPVVAVGPYHGNGSLYKPSSVDAVDSRGVYEVSYLIENFVTGFVSDHVSELRSYIQSLLEDRGLAESVSAAAKVAATKIFGIDSIKREWRRLFELLDLM